MLTFRDIQSILNEAGKKVTVSNVLKHSQIDWPSRISSKQSRFFHFTTFFTITLYILLLPVKGSSLIASFF